MRYRPAPRAAQAACEKTGAGAGRSWRQAGIRPGRAAGAGRDGLNAGGVRRHSCLSSGSPARKPAAGRASNAAAKLPGSGIAGPSCPTARPHEPAIAPLRAAVRVRPAALEHAARDGGRLAGHDGCGGDILPPCPAFAALHAALVRGSHRTDVPAASAPTSWLAAAAPPPDRRGARRAPVHEANRLAAGRRPCRRSPRTAQWRRADRAP